MLCGDDVKFFIFFIYHDKALTEAATGGVLRKRCSGMFRKIRMKTPVPESLFLIKFI